MDHIRPMLGQQLADRWPGDDVSEIEHPQTLKGPEGSRLERCCGPVGDLGDFDQRHTRNRFALRVCKPFLGASLDGSAEPEGGKFVLERLRIELGHAASDRGMLARAIQKAQDTVAQMLICAVEEDLAVVARAVEAVDRREDGSEIELPAALKEKCSLVEKQLRMPSVDAYLLGAKTAAFADRSHGASDRPQRRRREIGRLDDGVDVARRLFDCDGAGLGFGKPQPAGDFAQYLLLTFVVHGRPPQSEAAK